MKDRPVKLAINIPKETIFNIYIYYNFLPEANSSEFKVLPTIEDKRNVDRIFLNGRFNESINDNKLLYARALKKVNGLTPKENFKALYNVMSWYAKDITLRQAAIECGISVENFISTMKNKKKITWTDSSVVK